MEKKKKKKLRFTYIIIIQTHTKLVHICAAKGNIHTQHGWDQQERGSERRSWLRTNGGFL